MPNTLRLQVVEVTDGDTIKAQAPNGDTITVRLWGIDAPETDQPCGTGATKVARKVAGGEVVEVEPVEEDRYGRVVGRVHVNGTTLGRTLTRSGYAWHGRRYPTSEQLKANEGEARTEGRGLWAQSNPVPPWRHRNGRAPAPSGEEVLESIGWMLAGALAVLLPILIAVLAS